MQREEQRQRTRAALMTAAAHQFEERGFTAASLSDVAETLGLVRATVHFHFATKEKLASEIIAFADQAWEGARRDVEGRNAQARLRAVAEAVGASWASDVRLRGASRLMLEPRFSRVSSAGAWTGFVGEQLAAGQSDGSIALSVDPERDAALLVAMASGVLHALPPGQVGTARASMRRLCDLVAGTIAAD